MIKPRAEVLRMNRYSPPIENRKGYIRMDFNENTIGCSPNVIAELKKLKCEDLSVYPEYDLINKQLAGYLKVKPGQVMLANGSDEAIKCVIDTFICKGDRILIPVPTYAMFQVYADIAGAKLKKILYNKDLSFPTRKILGNIDLKTRMVILPNPNNPTATEISQDDMEKILKKAKNCLVLVDEAYYQFMKKSSIRFIEKYKNLIVIQTFSKAFGLAGARIGYAISNEENIRILKKVLSPYSVNRLAVAAASAALKDKRYIECYVRQVEESKKLLYNAFKELKIRAYPSSANFILADFGDKCEKVCEGLLRKNILVRDRSSDILLKGHIRITAGTKEQTKKLITALREIL